jgi:hypothetical protein
MGRGGGDCGSGVSLSTMYAMSLDTKMPLVEREEEQAEEGRATAGPKRRHAAVACKELRRPVVP